MPHQEETRSVAEVIESFKKFLEKEKKEKPKPFATIALLVFGTLLTVLSSLTISYFTDKNNDETETRKAKLAVIEKIGRDAEIRSILCNDLMNARNDYNDKAKHTAAYATMLDTARNRYVLERLRFDASAVVYQAQLLKYFSKADRDQFKYQIYYDLIDLGNAAELDIYDKVNRSNFTAVRIKLESKIQAFCDKLYLEVN